MNNEIKNIFEQQINILDKEIKNIEKHNRVVTKLNEIKKLINNDKYEIIKITPKAIKEVLEYFKTNNIEEIIKDIEYIIYIYKYYISNKNCEEFSQKKEADSKISKLIMALNNIKVTEYKEYDELKNIYNKMKDIYNNLKNGKSKKINQIDVINYINLSNNLTNEEKENFIININTYNSNIDKTNELLFDKKEDTLPKEFDLYIKTFCEMMLSLSEEEIKKNLPESFMVNCMYILNNMLEYTDYKLQSDKDNTKYQKLKKVLVSYKAKIENEIKAEFIEDSENLDSIYKNRIIYLNEYVFNDIKNINYNLYEEIKKAIEDLEFGNFSTNTAKHKKFKNNGNLKGVFEIKRETVRLFYKSIGNHTYVVLLIGQKRTMADTTLTDKVEKRVPEVNLFFTKSPESIDQFVNRGNEITEELKNILEEKKRKM